MANITKTDLIDALADRLSITKDLAGALIDELIDIICNETEAGKTVSISDFGRFVVKETAKHPGRNPRTDEAIIIAAKRTLTFKSSKPSP